MTTAQPDRGNSFANGPKPDGAKFPPGVGPSGGTDIYGAPSAPRWNS